MQSIRFIWQGVTKRKAHWSDGLREAMRILEKKYEVTYHEPDGDVPDGLVLYWEAPCTINSKDGEKYRTIKNRPGKKVLLFAGGPVQKEWVDGFDHVCVESEISEKEFSAIGVPNSRAFGINDTIFKPQQVEKIFDGVHHGTSASWKRQWLMTEALREKALCVGRIQPHDTKPYDKCIEHGSTWIDEQPYTSLPGLISQAHVCVNTCEYWGGGQRTTLEAMACGIPVIAMSDSPKNREYVEESGAGLVVDPSPDKVKQAVAEIKTWTKKEKERGIAYIKSKWTAKHYADALDKVIQSL